MDETKPTDEQLEKIALFYCYRQGNKLKMSILPEASRYEVYGYLLVVLRKLEETLSQELNGNGAK